MSKKSTILCVDDEECILSSLRRTLRTEGYEVLEALSGQMGLSILKDHDVDLVISDQRMPEMSGYEFLRQVKADYPSALRVMLSGYSDIDSLIRTINEGEILRFIPKPWDNEELKQIISSLLNQHSAQEDILRLLDNLRDILHNTQDVELETMNDGTMILMKVLPRNGKITQDAISNYMNLIVRTLGLDGKKKVDVVSNSISKENGRIVFHFDLRQGILLKIQIPECQGVESSDAS
ncbi:MAG: response regulator [Candidatus Omnitrophica bacterium]|nr:response regulator [Candidatus Omnitrophota bacterium]